MPLSVSSIPQSAERLGDGAGRGGEGWRPCDFFLSLYIYQANVVTGKHRLMRQRKKNPIKISTIETVNNPFPLIVTIVF